MPASPELPALSRRLARAVAQEGTDLLGSVGADGLKDALEEAELLDMEQLLGLAGDGLQQAKGSPAYKAAMAELLSRVQGSVIWASVDPATTFHVETLLAKVVEMAVLNRPESLKMRRDLASTRVTVSPAADVRAAINVEEDVPEAKPKVKTGAEWLSYVSEYVEGQLGRLPDVNDWPFDHDLLVACEMLSADRPRLPQLGQLQLPQSGALNTSGALVTATRNKVYYHDRGYNRDDELDLLEDYIRLLTWGAAMPIKGSWFRLEELDRRSGVALDDGEEVPLLGLRVPMMELATQARRQAHHYDLDPEATAEYVDKVIDMLTRGVSNERRTLTVLSDQVCLELAKMARESATTTGTHSRDPGRVTGTGRASNTNDARYDDEPRGGSGRTSRHIGLFGVKRFGKSNNNISSDSLKILHHCILPSRRTIPNK